MKLLDVLTSPCAIEPAKLIKRAHAKLAGHMHYFTGKPCSQGHIAIRRVINGGCQICLNERYAAWRTANPMKAIAASKNWKDKHRDELLSTRKAIRSSPAGKEKLAIQRANLYAKETEKHQARGRAFYHAHHEVCRARNRRYIASIPGYNKERTAKRRAALLQAMPIWADQNSIKAIYANCPAGMQVDHFVPLHGVMPDGCLVRGLHVPNNLRYLTAFENASRRNRMTKAEVKALELTT